MDRRRAALPRGAAELPRPADARDDEKLDGRRHPSIANRADWGVVLGGFKWSYALLSPFGGYIADRVSRRHVIAASLFLWSAVTWWTGRVTTFHELMAARVFMGGSEAFYFPAALALFTDYHVGDTRSRAVGVHQTGIYLGQILGGFAGYVADSPAHG